MKQSLIILACLLLGQTPTIISLKEFYCGRGAIFDKAHRCPVVTSDYHAPLTPIVDDVKEAEQILFVNYYEHQKKVLDSFNSSYKVDLKLKNPKKVKKKFAKYNRQYAGYTTSSNDTIIYVGLFNFSKPKKAAQYFEGWDKILFLGSGEYYQENQEAYLINITQNKILFK